MNTDRIRCTEAIEKLPLFVGGDLDPEVQAAVRAHLAGCPGCAARAGAAGRGRGALLDALQERARKDERPDLWTGIRAKLVAEGRIAGREAPGRTRDDLAARPAPRPIAGRRWARLVAPLAAAAAVALVLQGGGFLDGGRGRGPGAIPHEPPVTLVDHPVAAPGAGIQPVSLVESEDAPQAGFLRRRPAEEAAAEQSVQPFRRRLERLAPGDPGISLTRYR